MKQKKVCVLLSTYNHENFIAEAINNVLMQEVNFDYEVTIIEDCSTDKTRDIAVDFRNRYPEKIHLVLAERNRNDNSAWRQVISTASSCYLALLDGDDYWTSTLKLQKQVDFMEAHPDCSICFHNVTAVYEDSSALPYTFNSAEQKTILTIDDLWIGNVIAGCSSILRRDAIEEIPEWFVKVKRADWALYILAAHHGNIVYLDEVMGVYRIHDRGLWSGMDETEQNEETIQFYEEINVNLRLRYNEIIEPLLAENYWKLARLYEDIGKLEKAALCMRKASFSSR